jgi:hypothetical protein
MRNVNLEKWRGKRDPVRLDPTALEFQARRGGKCDACAFNEQWSEVCGVANEEALRRGLKRCEDGVVYVLIEKDPLQLDCVEAARG